MKKEKVIALTGVLLFTILSLYLLVSVSQTTGAAFYDSTSVESKVNVTNSAPVVTQVLVYELDDLSEVSIDLSEGTTETITCNATIDDLNGLSDIIRINATLFDDTSYNEQSGTDNNYNYFVSSCTNSTINVSAIEVSCNFAVWYYANNASWNCNISAADMGNLIGTGIDSTPPTITQLIALNLSGTTIDFGGMSPGDITANADEPVMNVTNLGNTNFNLSLDGYGVTDGDGLAMDCTSGNIPIEYMDYNFTDDQTYDTNMWNLTDNQLTSGIPGLSIVQRTDDSDTKHVKSTNSTYWKIRIPVASAGGFCNGTVTYAAVV